MTQTKPRAAWRWLPLAAAIAAAPAQADKARDTLTWTSNKELPFVLPYYNQNREIVVTAANVWDTMIYRNPETSRYEPLLARSWRWLDERTLELELREGVVFHDGSGFDADDVVDTLNHVSGADSGVILRAFVDWIEQAEKVGPMVVRIRAKKPYPAALEMLSGPLPIFPSGIWETAKVNAAGRKDYGTVAPIGTGPYRIARVKPGESFTMVANPRYFAGPKPAPRIKTVVYRTILDQESALAELLTGGVDWVPFVSQDKAGQLKGMPGVAIAVGPTLRLSLLGFDVTGRSGQTPLADLKVRQAIAHAIDRQAIVDRLIGGGAQVMHSGCYPLQAGCTDEGVPRYAYGPAKARALLEDAGLPNGFRTAIHAFREREYTEAVVGYLRAVGINAEIRFMQLQRMEQLMAEGKTEIYMHSYGSGGIFDASAVLGAFFHGQANDYCRDPEVVRWVQEGDTTVDPARRTEAYRKALTRIAEKLCWLPLFNYGSYYAISADLNFRPNAAEVHEWFRASWK